MPNSRRFLTLVLCAAAGYAASAEPPAATGRPVRVVSISLSEGTSLEDACALVDREGAMGADLILLPETWRGHTPPLDTVEGPTIPAMAALARKHGAYIVCPLDRMAGEQRLNTAFLIDRSGNVAGLYDKVFPYWSEFDLEPPVDVGSDAPVFDTDFGKLGIAICFDVNFPEVWQRLADGGAELVVWPSAYSAGTSLQAHAINHHFYIVTCTLVHDCLVYDITGEQLLYEKGKDLNVSRITLDLDRGIYHQNFNMEGRAKLLRKHADDIEQEKWLDREQWFVLRAKRPGVSARALAREYGLEELRQYIARSRKHIDGLRGHAFANSSGNRDVE